MNIVIDTAGFGKANSLETVKNSFINLAKDFPDHVFLILTSGEKSIGPAVSNVIFEEVVLSTRTTFYAWYKYQKSISVILKKHKADLFVTSILFSKILLKTEQILLVGHLAPLIYTFSFTKDEQSFYKKYITNSIRKANKIITSSDKWKEEIIQGFKKSADQIELLLPKNIERTIPTLSIKNKLTENCEYFLVVDQRIDTPKLIYLLKAFSAFKKRLKSSMKIIFLLKKEQQPEFESGIKSYKYRNDIVQVIINQEEHIYPYTHEAYAIIYNCIYTDFEYNVPDTINSNTIMIAADSDYNDARRLLKEAAVYYNYKDITSLAEAMIKIYKDEILRNKLILLQNEYALNWKKDKKLGSFCNL